MTVDATPAKPFYKSLFVQVVAALLLGIVLAWRRRTSPSA
jgi:hypothetical protein